MEDPDLFSYKNTAPAPLVEETAPSFPAAVVPKLPNERSPGSNPKAINRSLVVSIHDVSPLTREATERILCELDEIGVHRVSLLVIPDHHHKGNLLDDPEFCAWLRRCSAAGHEIVIHGYYHRRDQKAGETFWQKMATRYYTAGEGEFYDIAGADALRIVSQARQEFRNVGLDPQGFVAPAWLLSDGADRALQRLGIAYTTRIGGVFDYTRGVHHTSQSLVWSTRSAVRRLISRFWNTHLFRRLEACPLLRMGIHPPDMGHEAVWRQIKELTVRALETRTAKTYAGYLNRE
ncbi:MAG: polysaccharide deacetylase family protein [Verrucomicrobia bacterium]|nr:polysaccharide deacetylase family protein [Verrucomicrobiota bacterium]